MCHGTDTPECEPCAGFGRRCGPVARAGVSKVTISVNEMEKNVNRPALGGDGKKVGGDVSEGGLKDPSASADGTPD